jgi:superfamily II DNA/RNA helicase
MMMQFVYHFYSKVLDEADRLLTNEGLLNTIHELLPKLPTKRQTLLFSATMTITEEQMEPLRMKEPFAFSVGAA